MRKTEEILQEKFVLLRFLYANLAHPPLARLHRAQVRFAFCIYIHTPTAGSRARYAVSLVLLMIRKCRAEALSREGGLGNERGSEGPEARERERRGGGCTTGAGSAITISPLGSIICLIGLLYVLHRSLQTVHAMHAYVSRRPGHFLSQAALTSVQANGRIIPIPTSETTREASSSALPRSKSAIPIFSTVRSRVSPCRDGRHGKSV